jgi:hypothetical protein
MSFFTTEQHFNVIDPSMIKKCIDDYYSNSTFETDTMNKADTKNVLGLLTPMIENMLGKNLMYTGGNFYRHDKPYLPHTDYKTYENNTLNVVIPLSYTNSQPSLIIFDQKWELDSVTWCMQYSVQYFRYNIGVKGCPAEYPVIGLTDKEIDNELYTKYLNHYPKIFLRGLSGKVFPFEVGSILVFDNRHIHCTSKLDGEKLGISLRFKIL